METGIVTPYEIPLIGGIARAQYGKYEKGGSDIRFSTLIGVIEELGVTPEEVFREF